MKEKTPRKDIIKIRSKISLDSQFNFLLFLLSFGPQTIKKKKIKKKMFGNLGILLSFPFEKKVNEGHHKEKKIKMAPLTTSFHLWTLWSYCCGSYQRTKGMSKGKERTCGTCGHYISFFFFLSRRV